MSRRVLISFSGGRTSAFMTLLLVAWCLAFGVEFVIVFANTGEEDERTLRFIDQFARYFGLAVIWVEATVHPGERKASTARVVTFETASRKGEPFEAVIGKYGLPNKGYNHCNRELKLNPIHDYVQTVLGWDKESYVTAIGIRLDEADRMLADASTQRLIYPLVRQGIRKRDVLAFWAKQPFDLYVPEHLGNCRWCWKKSLRKHLTIAREAPEAFDFPERMEREHPFTGAAGDGEPRRIFRKGWTTADIRARAKLPFVPFRDGNHARDPELDDTDGCDEACDIYPPDLVDLMGRAA